MANTKGRIAISTNIVEMLNQATKVYNKHVVDGVQSPLNALIDNDWAKTGPTIAIALEKHNEAEKLKGEMEAAYRERDLLTPAIAEILQSSRNLLKSINSKNPKRIAEWGFNVDDSAKASKTTQL